MNIDQENLYIQNFQVQNAFSNLIENISGRSTLQLLTKKLVKHDIAADSISPPFRTIEEGEQLYSDAALSILSDSLNIEGKSPSEILRTQLSPELNKILKDVSKSLEYDYETLREQILIYRIGETDYLNIEYASEIPELSYYMVNTFTNDVIKLDRSIQSGEESSAYNFYEELVTEKKKAYDQLTKDLNDYKKSNNVVNLEEQTKSIVSQIKELELTKERYKKEIPSLRQNIRDLDAHIKRTARNNADDYSNTILLNADIEEVSSDISRLTDRYITGGSKDKGLKGRIDKLKLKRSKLIDRMASNEVINTDDNNGNN